MVHSDKPHSSLVLSSVPNLKLKDMRQQELVLKENKKTKPQPTFSDLFVSFGDDTNHSCMFFINRKEVLLSQTRYGKYFRDSSEAIIKDLFYDFKVRTLSINRDKIKKYFKEIPGVLRSEAAASILETKTITIATQEGSEMKTLRGKEISFLSHNFGDSIIGLHLKDDINDRTYGDYQYSIQFSFRDPTINYVTTIVHTLRTIVDMSKQYGDSLLLKNNYDNFLRRPTSTFFSNSSDLHISLPEQVHKYKTLLYEMSEDERQKDLFRMYSLLNPKTCTRSSVQRFTSEASLVLQNLISLFDVSPDSLKPSYNNPAAPKTDFRTNNFTVEHKFKNIVTPSDSKLHFVYNVKKITSDNIQEAISPSPEYVAARNNKTPFNERNKDKINSILNENIKTKSPQISFTVSTTATPQDTEAFINSSDYLGNETKFQSFKTKEKCEIPRFDTNPAIENSIITGEGDLQNAVIEENQNKMEILVGFATLNNDTINLKKPNWQNYNGEKVSSVMILKQTPVRGSNEKTNLPFSNKYIVLNNSGVFSIQKSSNINNNILRTKYYQSINYNFIYTTNSIVVNIPNNTTQDITQMSAQPATQVTTQPTTQVTTQPTTQMSAQPTTQMTTGGGY